MKKNDLKKSFIVVYILVALAISFGAALSVYDSRGHEPDHAGPRSDLSRELPDRLENVTTAAPEIRQSAGMTIAASDASSKAKAASTASDDRAVAWEPTVKPTPTPTAEPTQTPTPVESIADYRGGYAIETSSYRINRDKSISVDGYCAVDGDTNTAWNTNRNTVDEWIRLSVRDGNRYSVSGFIVANGYWKSEKVYRNNARARTVDVYCDDALVQQYQFADSREYQRFYFSQPMLCSSVKFVIRDGYPGKEYEDCCITEIALIGP